MVIPQHGQNRLENLFAALFGGNDRHFPYVSNFGLKFAPDLIHRVVLEDDWGRSLIWGVTMGTAHLAHDQHDRREDCRLRDDEHADDVLSLLEENARLRGLVVKLSNLILRNVADQK